MSFMVVIQLPQSFFRLFIHAGSLCTCYVSQLWIACRSFFPGPGHTYCEVNFMCICTYHSVSLASLQQNFMLCCLELCTVTWVGALLSGAVVGTLVWST